MSSSAELEAWLDERCHFEGGHLSQVRWSSDEAITLTLDQYLRLGLRPGDVSVVAVHELVVARPIEFEAPARHDSDEFVGGVDASGVPGRWVVQVELAHGWLRVIGGDITVREVTTEHRRTKPWVTTELTVPATAAHGDQYWTSRVSDVLGVSVVWRVLGGREPRDPGLDADGCFLQTASRLASTDHGVFCTRSSGAARTTLSCYHSDEVDAALWRAVRLVAGDFDRIQSGNCVFDSADWMDYLATQRFPPDQRLRGAI